MNFLLLNNKVEWPIIKRIWRKRRFESVKQTVFISFFPPFSIVFNRTSYIMLFWKRNFSVVCAALWFSYTTFFFFFIFVLFCTSAIVRSWRKIRRNKISKCNKICIIFSYGEKKKFMQILTLVLQNGNDLFFSGGMKPSI